MNLSGLVGCLLYLPEIQGAKTNAVSPNPDEREGIDIFKLRADGVEVTSLLEENGHSQFIAILENGVILNDGYVMVSNGDAYAPLTDVQIGQPDQYPLLSEAHEAIEKNLTYFDGSLAVISSVSSDNWYHWLLQILPRLIILSYPGIAYDKIRYISASWSINGKGSHWTLS